MDRYFKFRTEYHQIISPEIHSKGTKGEISNYFLIEIHARFSNCSNINSS